MPDLYCCAGAVLYKSKQKCETQRHVFMLMQLKCTKVNEQRALRICFIVMGSHRTATFYAVSWAIVFERGTYWNVTSASHVGSCSLAVGSWRTHSRARVRVCACGCAHTHTHTCMARLVACVFFSCRHQHKYGALSGLCASC